MYADYNDVLKRLIEERHRLCKSQKEMSRYARMSQSNYSKIELGLRRLSYHELQYLCESDADVHYIFTNQKGNAIYNDFLDKCSYSELICYLSVIYSIVVLRNSKESTAQRKSILERLKYIPLIEENRHSDNIFLILRKSLNYQQKKMADMLGVDVKKLRQLENGRRLPDSELLWRLYSLFHIPPAVVLKDRKGLVSEVSFLLEMLENRKEIYQILKTLHDMK